MFKQIKNNKGFTLVEVIVVAVIVLILAAVAIPLYNGYIRDSRQSTVSNAAVAIANGLGAMRQSYGDAATYNLSGGSPAVTVNRTLYMGRTGETSLNSLVIPQGLTVVIDGNATAGGSVVVSHGQSASVSHTAFW
ncbi:MAG: prepilin-type N-terminal cleavage/methylation domain-containing protein [Bacteroidales bacterium]|jgi:type IV pilus assembly protein PilE|nr:prepilin-type N-terminal cleavage/methylation domain-containing protein [Bacteroidales bacterium]